MVRLKPTLEALDSRGIKSQFDIKIYLQVSDSGTLIPVGKKFRKASHYTLVLKVQYPTYEDELSIKQTCTVFDRQNQVHIVDFDRLSAMRVEKCLVAWNLPEILPEITTQEIIRVNEAVTRECMAVWRGLPPLLRKEIASQINMAVGPF